MDTDFFDVIIVGAGLSGIGMACHLTKKCPKKSYVILEKRDSMGGTWDLFRYPGIRSDSDMHTLGYNFKPWRDKKAIADGPSILKYIKETAQDHKIDSHIRYGHNVTKMSWSRQDATWTIDAKVGGETVQIKCRFLLVCSGYYNYEQGYTPKFEGEEDFKGTIFHPQKWPEGLDYKNKKVIVIGSGATAVTLIPSMAKDTEHITMLQRSPTYIVSRPAKDKIANILNAILPKKLAYSIVRYKNIKIQRYYYRKAREAPKKAKHFLVGLVRKELGDDYDVAKHFTPEYNPWDQRVCLVPDSDLFNVIKSGEASIVTDHIDRFTENGILLKSGRQLEADIIITATGLNIQALGGAEVYLDEEKISFPDTITYKGAMHTQVPNLVLTFGYTNASWTLRADLIADYTCRLINYMDQKNYISCTPQLREHEQNMKTKPWLEDFSSGYIQRALHMLPKQGEHLPWLNTQNYELEKTLFLKEPIDDGVLIFA